MKIILSESQVKKLVKGISKTQLNEGVSDSYSKEIKTYFYDSGVTYKGKQIDNISRPTINMSYSIDIDAREWGIKDISLYGIDGPSEIEVEVDFWVDEDNTNSEVVTLPINWEMLKTKSNAGEGIVTIGDELEITLRNDENGNIIITEMELEIYTL